MFRLKYTEDILLSITKNSETLIEQTHMTPQRILQFKFIRPMQTLIFPPSIELALGCKWMTGITSLEVYNFVSITTKKNIFKRYRVYNDRFPSHTIKHK